MFLNRNSFRAAFILSLLPPFTWARKQDYSQYVNVFTGTEGGGNNFPGVTRPFGMVKIGPDLFVRGVDSYSGYLPNGRFSGFSMMHEQGTGGAPKYGTVAQLPLLGSITNPLGSLTTGRRIPDEGSLGYYRAETEEHVVVEMTATSRAGMYRYTFPENSTRNNILIDVSHVLPSFRGQGLGQGYAGGEIYILPDGHYEAVGTYNNGWNRSPNWRIYSCGYFDTNSSTSNVYISSKNGSIVQPSRTANSSSSVGAIFTFNSTKILSRVGISWISKQKACENVDRQIPEGTEFSSIVEETKQVWNEEILSKITTATTNTTNLQLLYTSIYFMNLLPTNQTGENPGWNSSEPYYSDIFTLWDTFRCSTALLQIIHPKAYEEFIRALIDIWRFDGYLPDGRSSNYNGRTQGGSNSDNVLADAYVKGVRGRVNWTDGYVAMVKDAEVTPVNDNPDPMAPGSSTKEGRGALPDWLEHGSITTKYARSASQAVEYAYNDFCLHQIAKGLNRTDDAGRYLNRSRQWRHHWNPEQEAIGFKGFVVPKNLTDFLPTNPLTDSGYWGDPYYQATSYAYSFGDVHDMETLVEWMGGKDQFLARLDAIFEIGANPDNPDGILFDSTNEPSFNIPYLYNFINRQDHSVLQSRTIAKRDYNCSPTGLPGNSDAGAMQTWLLWNMIGLYPVTGQTTFLIHSPWFESLTINLGNGKTLSITSTGGDGNGDRDYYVQSLKVNGKTWDRNWVTWDDIFERGGTMEFVLGLEVKRWDDGEVPPSPASERKAVQTIPEVSAAPPRLLDGIPRMFRSSMKHMLRWAGRPRNIPHSTTHF